MITRAEIVSEARAWIGTPYQHQAHLRGVGCDCGGLIGGVAVALGIVPPDWWDTEFARHAGYARQPTGDSLIDVLSEFMTATDSDTAQPGDVVVMRFKLDPTHVGFLADYVHGGLSLIHALNGIGVRAVTEHRIDAQWRNRVTHAFKMPGVN